MLFPQGHALLIGVSSYHYAPQMNVPITASDAQAVADVLCNPQFCGYLPEQVTVLRDREATQTGILCALDELAQHTTADDTVLLFYCGHGDYGDDNNYYLTTHDTRIARRNVVANTGVSHQQLLTKLQAIPTRRTLLIFNACHSGEISPTLGGSTPAQGHMIPDTLATALLATGEGRIIITACRETQYSFIGNGSLTIFTQALVDSLCGKTTRSQHGYVSVFDLYTAIYTTVSEAVRTQYHSEQHPELTIHKGIGSFAVARWRGVTKRGEFLSQTVPTEQAAIRQIDQQESQRLLHFIQSGGLRFGSHTTVQGDVTGGDEQIGGDKVSGQKAGRNIAGRDMNKPQHTFHIGSIQSGITNVGGTVHIDEPMTIDMGDTFTMSGNFQGAIINIKSQLEHVAQSIHSLPNANQETKPHLTQLLTQLGDLLQHVPPDRANDVEKVVRRVQALIDEVGKADQDTELIAFHRESLKRAANNIATIVPAIRPVVTQIESCIASLTH